MNKEDFVSYEIAQALKKAGFDWPCKYYYTKESAKDKNVWLTFTLGASEDFNRENKIRRSLGICSAPTLAQAQKWLRVQMGMDVYVIPRWQNAYEVVARELGKRPADTRLLFNLWDYAKPYDTYESALSAGITAALEILTDQAPAGA